MFDHPPKDVARRMPLRGCPWPGRDRNARLRQGPATVVPKPREGAWMEVHKSFLAQAKKGHIDLLFLGDSITQGWNENTRLAEVLRTSARGQFRHRRRPDAARPVADSERRARWHRAQGHRPHDRHQQPPRRHARRDRPGNQDASSPSCAAACPRPRSCCSACFPRSPKPDAARERIKSINEKIARLDDGSHVRFLDIGKAFLNPDGTISPEVMPDYLHLSTKGYRIWAEAMEPTLWSMLDEPK